MEWSAAAVLKLINLYEQFECLWNVQSSKYKSTDLKNKAWKEISKHMKQDVNEIKKKMKNLRTVYFAEKKREKKREMENNNKSCSSLFYYNAMAFLDLAGVLKRTSCLKPKSIELQPEDCSTNSIELISTFSQNASPPSSLSKAAFWQNWLEKYKSFHCLWKTPLQTKTNRGDRLRAWNILIEMAKTVDVNADAFYVQAILRQFLHKYKLQVKKIEVAKSNGISYRPKIYYYKILKSVYVAKEDPTEKRTEHQINFLKVLNQYVYYQRLWRRNSYTYKDKLMHWRKLKKMARVCFPNITIQTLKARIRNCRTIYLKERKKLEAAEKNGEFYKPKLFYYDVLEQLQEKNEYIIDNLDDSSQTDVDLEVNDVNDEASANCMSDKRRRSREKTIWRKLLKRYVHYKLLWDNETSRAGSFKERDAAWRDLLTILREAKPNADLAYLKSRINSSRSIFKREFNKITHEKRHGREYKSKLFYYDILSALYLKEGGNTIIFSANESTTDEETELLNEKTSPSIKNLKALEAELKQKDLIYAPLNSNPKYFERKVWLDVIKKYIYCECLWNTENRDYFNPDERNYAWLALTEIARKNNKDADIKYVKKRIKHFRTAYVRQLKIARTAKAKGEDYDIKLFYFNALSPIYQSGFPILNYDNDDVTLDKNALDCKNLLNPLSNTYYPDDSSSDESFKNARSEKYGNFEHVIEKVENCDVDTATFDNFEEDIKYGPTADNLRVFEDTFCFETEMSTEMTPQAHADSTFVENAGFKPFATFAEKTLLHLEAMEETQFFLAEKFISDVCISGRQKELTKTSCIMLKKNAEM